MSIGPWGKAVKSSLIASDITMKDMAADIGLTPTYVSAVINGRVLSPDVKKKISNYLG